MTIRTFIHRFVEYLTGIVQLACLAHMRIAQWYFLTSFVAAAVFSALVI